MNKTAAISREQPGAVRGLGLGGGVRGGWGGGVSDSASVRDEVPLLPGR